MKYIKKEGLYSQDCVHLLAKMRTRLLSPSNILVLGNETACRAHIQQVLTEFPKEQHKLTERIISNKDKQNYSSISVQVDDNIINCHKKLTDKMNNMGTITYIQTAPLINL